MKPLKPHSSVFLAGPHRPIPGGERIEICAPGRSNPLSEAATSSVNPIVSL